MADWARIAHALECIKTKEQAEHTKSLEQQQLLASAAQDVERRTDPGTVVDAKLLNQFHLFASSAVQTRRNVDAVEAAQRSRVQRWTGVQNNVAQQAEQQVIASGQREDKQQTAEFRPGHLQGR